MGKIEFTAGSPGWGTRGERCPHNDATLKRVAQIYANQSLCNPLPGLSQGERCLSHGYAFGITRG